MLVEVDGGFEHKTNSITLDLPPKCAKLSSTSLFWAANCSKLPFTSEKGCRLGKGARQRGSAKGRGKGRGKVSVTERTRETGLKLAIGADCSRIRLQFLTEAAVLTLIGGLLGVVLGIGLSYLLSFVMETPVAVSPAACVVTVVFSVVIGLVFGLAPAVRASRLNPIEALRYEQACEYPFCNLIMETKNALRGGRSFLNGAGERT